MSSVITPLDKFNLETYFKQTTAFFKSAENLVALAARSLDVVSEKGDLLGYLLPLTPLDKSDEVKISLLAEWRAAHEYAYPTRFPVTFDGTKSWLSKAVVDNNSRLLFWVTDLHLRPLGHLGLIYDELSNSLEIDNVLRGVPDVPGIMAASMLRIERFAEQEFSVDTLSLRVLGSNSRAVAFYKALGYEETQKTSLTEVSENGSLSLVPGLPEKDFFLTLKKLLVENTSVPDLILTAGPDIGAKEKAFSFDAVSTGWNSHHSDYLNSFETEFAKYVGSEFAMATSSCTGALHLSLLALGLGPGDEVIVPEITWVATASAVSYVGATPIFADVDPQSWLITAEQIESKITEKTKAIIPVHLYGFAALMPAIIAIAQKYNLAVVEDAAPAIGSLVGQKAVGTFGDFGCFSFQGAKMLVTGEGGMLVTDNPDLFARAKKLQDHGRKPGTFWIEELGYKFKMSNGTAALGLGQLHRGENQINRKRRIRGWYEEEFREIKGIQMQFESSGTRSIHWMSSILLGQNIGISRDDLISELRRAGIDSRPVFPAISQYGFWPQPQKPGSTALRVGNNAINLPSGVGLSRKSVAKVGEVVRKLTS
jgi:perosamine synthetase